MSAGRAFLLKSQFSGGEIAPQLHGRLELPRVAAGMDRVENFVVRSEGSLTRRPGTRYMGELKAQDRIGQMIPFEYDQTDSYMLVFSGGVMRVYRSNGVVLNSAGTEPYELAHPWTDEDLENLRYAQSLDVIFLACKGQKPKVLKRFDHNNWTLTDYVFENGPLDPTNTGAITLKASAATGTVTLTASASLFVAGMVGSVWRIEPANLANVPLWLGGELSVATGQLRRNAGKVYKCVLGPRDASVNAPVHTEGQVSSGNGKVTWEFVYNIGTFVTITAVTDGVTATATVSGELPADAVNPNATLHWSAGAWSSSSGWPEFILPYDQRLVWARGNRIWLTKTGDLYNFETGTTDDAAVDITLTSPDGRNIALQWLANTGVILMGTPSAEWMLRGGQNFDPITPTNVRAVPDDSEGSAWHRPVIMKGGVAYLDASRQRVHFALLDRLGEKIGVENLSLFASHALATDRAEELAWQKNPHRIIWIRTASGKLRGITYDREQEIIGWHRHDVGGFVERISCKPAETGQYDELWLIVRRTVSGVVKRYLEVMTPYFVPQSEDAPTAAGAWFVDCGLSLVSPTPVSTILAGGLSHLAGETVALFLDGAQAPHQVVPADGSLALPYPASSVLIGLPITGRVRTLPVDTTLSSGSTKMQIKTPGRVLVECAYAYGGTVSINDFMAEPLMPSGGERKGTAKALVSTLAPVQPLSAPEMRQQITLTCANAYPFTLTGLSPDLELSGG